MKANGKDTRSIWREADGAIGIIDQLALPHELRTATLRTVDEVLCAIREMRVRGAPLIGAAAAYGMALAAQADASDAALARAAALVTAARPTAINLRWAVERVRTGLEDVRVKDRAEVAYRIADEICNEDVAINERIGEHGVKLLYDLARRNPGRPVQIMTHCNAGWLATVDWGTATAPVYRAHRDGLSIHVWVAETRPRLQGALTAWELAQEGVPHTIMADSAAGHLMQRGDVDIVVTGTDRVTAAGDVANKIGTYLKALAARDNGIPFYVAAPSPSIDWSTQHGRDIPIEERDARELACISGRDAGGDVREVFVHPRDTRVFNAAFDVTPARLVTGLVTERGVTAATQQGLAQLFGRERMVS